jgi:hypothetical protein
MMALNPLEVPEWARLAAFPRGACGERGHPSPTQQPRRVPAVLFKGMVARLW